MERAVASITGAAGGILAGRAVAPARHGSAVVVGDRDAETLESAPHAASERGISAKTCACDVARADDCRRPAHVALERFGKSICYSPTQGSRSRAVSPPLTPVGGVRS
jgi:NAD(P)-dependent dehydrogenase (short-subunit alcohol dehydrogenase family)